MMPSGASTGAFEAVELRDGADAFGGKGVQNVAQRQSGSETGRMRARKPSLIAMIELMAPKISRLQLTRFWV